jgi:hypothetical protein
MNHDHESPALLSNDDLASVSGGRARDHIVDAEPSARLPGQRQQQQAIIANVPTISIFPTWHVIF